MRRWFSILVGMAGMAPTQFWNLSPRELYAALDGFVEHHRDPSQVDPMDRGELESLMELYPD